MPNIQQLLSLKAAFWELDQSEEEIKEFVERKRIKSRDIQKAFSLDERSLLEHIDSVTGIPELIKYFERSPSEEVVLMYIDITGFSRKMQYKTASELKRYLDQYYNTLIPIIYKHDGQIEKIMGDGIICIFGKPFIKLPAIAWVAKYAENCAKEAIQTLSSTNMAVKVAMHVGTITYYKIPGNFYDEYTMIGSPLTDLHRLESVSEGNAINFYKFGDYDEINPKDGENIWTEISKESVRISEKPITVSGVSFDKLRYLTFV
jgi:class 3 adenylate cyclase